MSEIFISYKRETMSHAAALAVKGCLEADFGHKVIWDENGIDTGDDIRAFMDKLSQGTNIIFVISKEFLKSPFCMYEMAKTAGRPAFKDRAFAILLPGVKLDDDAIFAVVEHWADEAEKLEQRASALRAKKPALVTQKMQERLEVLESIGVGASEALFNLAERKWIDADAQGQLDWEVFRAFVKRWAVLPTSETVTAPEETAPQTALPAPIQQLIADMVFVEGGTFQMGSNEGGDYDKAVHPVSLGNYHLSRFPITQEQWEALMGSNPSHFKGERNPVNYVSWNDCQQFIEKLNLLSGLDFRLPTEAEWEYAARGGKAFKGYTYSGSNDLDKVGWYAGNTNNKTHPVGEKAANELGLHDMSGNVWEWCSDWYVGEYYKKAPQSDPKGPGVGFFRVMRGGSFHDDTGNCRVSLRYFNEPENRNHHVGFRVVRD